MTLIAPCAHGQGAAELSATVSSGLRDSGKWLISQRLCAHLPGMMKYCLLTLMLPDLLAAKF